MKSKQISEFKETEVGKIPADWEINQLQEISSVIDSAHVTPKYSLDGIPMVRVTNIKKGFLNLDETLKVTPEIYTEFTKKYKPQKNDILMSRVGTYGVASFVDVDEPFCLGQNTVVIHSILNDFIYHALNSKLLQNQIEEKIDGSTQKTITLRNIRELLIPKPTHIAEIKKISKILFDLEYLIQNLQNQNKILEQMAQAIFKSWFVDFDGVTEFEDSELGKIPKGWSVEKLSNVISVDKGLSYKGKFLSTSGIPLINLGNIEKNGGFIERKIKHYTGEFKTKHTISSRDIVIANTDITQDRLVLGSPALISPLDSKEIIFTHHIFAVRINSNFKKYFLYYLLKTQNYHQHVISYATGTTVLAISKEAVLDFQFALPNDDLVNEFDNVASNMQELFYRNNSSIQSLTKTRDVLLPKLMSGEIRV